MKEKLYLIIVNWNRTEDSIKYLTSIKNNS